MDVGQVIHEIQMWGGWSWSGWVALGSIGTVGALIVALALGLGVTGLIFKPRLAVTLRPGLPDFCPVETTAVATIGKKETFTDEQGHSVQLPVPSVLKASDQYYCRFRVNNSGRWWSASANDVQVLLSELWNVGVTPAELVQPFLPVQLAWADMVTGNVLHPEMEVILPILQPDVFRYCNLCHVDRKTLELLEFNAKPEPNKMLGQWPTKKAPSHYEVDVVLTASNFERRFITFDIDFKGGAWPADNKSFDAMYTAKVVYQGKKRPGHPITESVLRRALRWLGLPVWMLMLIAAIWIALGVLALIPSNRSSLDWIAGYAVVLPLGALLVWGSPRWAQFVLVGLLLAGFGSGLAAGGLGSALGYVAIFPFAWIFPLFLLWLVRNAT